MDEHGALRRCTLVLVAVIGAAATELVLSVLSRTSGWAGRPSWVLGVLLAVVAGVLWNAARRIRATRDGTTDHPVPPIAAYRTLVLAQACALAGALAVGAYVVFVLRGLPDVDAASVRGDVIAAAVCVGGAGLLVVAGLRVQSVCRIDPPSPDSPDSVA